MMPKRILFAVVYTLINQKNNNNATYTFTPTSLIASAILSKKCHRSSNFMFIFVIIFTISADVIVNVLHFLSSYSQNGKNQNKKLDAQIFFVKFQQTMFKICKHLKSLKSVLAFNRIYRIYSRFLSRTILWYTANEKENSR